MNWLRSVPSPAGISPLLLGTLKSWTPFFLLWALECVPRQEESMQVMVGLKKSHSYFVYPRLSSNFCFFVFQRHFLAHPTSSSQVRHLILSVLAGVKQGDLWMHMWSSMYHCLALDSQLQQNYGRWVQGLLFLCIIGVWNNSCWCSNFAYHLFWISKPLSKARALVDF